ncbi:MAG: tyrosine-type recombinase/integrase, partial [Deltaproteobacteria bacterium]|nr:tyrosine-type recombinase/integrase [Deltaproteobacteria bacterium]
INVHRQWLEKQKIYGPTKNNVQRFIDFDPDGLLARVLRETIESSPDPEVIFVTANGRRVLPSSLARDTFRRANKRAGVPDICFHGLRHTFASWYVIEHDDFRSLQYLMGHKDVKTTQRYAHLSKRHRRTPLGMSERILGNEPKVTPISVVNPRPVQGEEGRF